jgi:hypothetical protein
MGATLPLSAVSARMLDVARGKYKMIQLELVDRCVQLHENTWGDRTKGLSAFGAAYVATMGIGSGAGAEGPATELVEVAWEYIKWIPGEIVNAVSLRVTDRLPSRKCPRVKRYKHLRLRCAVCLDCFDTSYVEFLRECLAQPRLCLARVLRAYTLT